LDAVEAARVLVMSVAEVCVFQDAGALAAHAAAWLAEKLGGGTPRRRAVCLSGGSTPRILYEALAQPPYREAMPWESIHWFWCDERFVPPTDERSNYRMVREALFDRAPVPGRCIHPIATAGGSPEAAATAYEEELQRLYGSTTLEAGRPLFDVTFLGVGEDGHTASLFPASPALKERMRWVARATDTAGAPRITLTYPVLESSREVVFLVTGAAKRDIVQRIFAGAAGLPAAMLRPAGRLHWFLDRAAGQGLSAGGVSKLW
jgi:6-phosphogluconolactonase